MAVFRIKDCALVVGMADIKPALNLRELYERIASCSVESIYHHFCEATLRPTFDDPDYRNDFAVWAKRALHDDLLSERLGILDPYNFSDFEKLRFTVLDIIDERLHEVSNIPWALPGMDFHFLRAMTVVFDTGHEIANPAELPHTISQMTTSSLYYHFLEARRRVGDGKDDFSAWLENWNGLGTTFKNALSSVDFYFLSLRDLQVELCKIASEVLREVTIA